MIESSRCNNYHKIAQTVCFLPCFTFCIFCTIAYGFQFLYCEFGEFVSSCWGWRFRVAALEDREYQIDRLEFVKNQLNLLIDDIKTKIKAISEDVASKVMWTTATSALTSLLHSLHQWLGILQSNFLMKPLSSNFFRMLHFKMIQ